MIFSFHLKSGGFAPTAQSVTDYTKTREIQIQGLEENFSGVLDDFAAKKLSRVIEDNDFLE